MDNSQFDVLVALILSGEANQDQKREFEEILGKSKEKQLAFEKIKRVWKVDIGHDNNGYNKEREELWERYLSEKQSNIKGHGYRTYFRIAAAILILVTLGYVYNQFLNQNANDQIIKPLAIREIIKETKPGEKLRTRLPDGTSVLLNAGSTLTFPEQFSNSSRIVYLIGEGFFDVAEDKLRPFTVRISTMDITALGTAFGVNAYQKNEYDQVALVSGKLLIKNTENQEVRIDSGKVVTLSKENNSFSTSDLDYLNQIAWKDGILHFENESFKNILDVLELNYGVTFVKDANLSTIKDTYTGSFENESLENLLKVLSFSMDFNYEINGKEILLTKKKKPDTRKSARS